MALADIHDPVRLAEALHRQIRELQGAVPVIDIAKGLDIAEVRQEKLDGCEGTLLTDRVRSRGSILVNTSAGEHRARFSMAHELGHFLLERHVLHGDSGFTCRSTDMREGRMDSMDHRQETEANLFAINLLAPPSLINDHLRGEPDIRKVVAMRNRLEISLEAAARRYVERHDAQLAVVFSRNSTVRYIDRQPSFPWIDLAVGGRLNPDCAAARFVRKGVSGRTAMEEVSSLWWLSRSEANLSEQTRLGRQGYAVTLLWVSHPDLDHHASDGSYRPDVPRSQ